MNLEQVFAHFGGLSKTARALGLNPSSVSEWKESGIPETRQYQIELATCGALMADLPARRDGVACDQESA